MKLKVDTKARTPKLRVSANGSPRAPRRFGRLGYGTRHLGFAAFLGILAVVLTLVYVHSYKRKVELGATNATVYVAAKDIPAGTSGSELVAGKALAVAHVPQRAIVPGAIATRRRLAGLVSTAPIYAGEQITLRRFSSRAALGIRGDVTGAMRAFALEGTAQQLLAGILQPGDHVDVVMAVRFRTQGGDEQVASRVILRDIPVLSAPEEPAAQAKIGGGASGSGLQAVVAVTARQTQKLFIATKHEWSLTLRPVGRAVDQATRADTSTGVIWGRGR